MKTILKFMIPLFVILLSSMEMMADIQIEVYGKGGIVVRPDSTTVVCPEWSRDKCANIIVEDGSLESLSCITGTLNYRGKSCKVEIIEMPNLQKSGNGYSCQSAVVKRLNL